MLQPGERVLVEVEVLADGGGPVVVVRIPIAGGVHSDLPVPRARLRVEAPPAARGPRGVDSPR